jgi:transposase InsO family protein
VRAAFVRAQAGVYSVRCLCRVLRLSRSGYYARQHRPESRHAREDRRLLVHVQAAHQETRAAYGAVKLWRALQQRGLGCGKHRVARLRRAAGMTARRTHRYRETRQQSPTSYPVVANTLQRAFAVPQPNRVWVGDITFIPTRAGWLHLAVLVDLFARRIVGWAMSATIDGALVTRALEMALTRRRARHGLIHHTDQGRQYATGTYQHLLHAHGMIPSMSRKGDCFDNACAESFFSTLKNELVHHATFHTREEARTAIFEYIEVFYNRQRLHQTLGYLTPAEYERRAGVSI